MTDYRPIPLSDFEEYPLEEMRRRAEGYYPYMCSHKGDEVMEEERRPLAGGTGL